jgi:hypothetical protein
MLAEIFVWTFLLAILPLVGGILQRNAPARSADDHGLA